MRQKHRNGQLAVATTNRARLPIDGLRRGEERIHEFHSGAIEIDRVARDERQIVHQRGSRDLLVDLVLGIRDS
jgi:hypothetical protein